jgi:hypothetical protein
MTRVLLIGSSQNSTISPRLPDGRKKKWAVRFVDILLRRDFIFRYFAKRNFITQSID